METLSSRVGEATSLNADFYDRVARDETATGQAVAVLLMACAAPKVWNLMSGNVKAVVGGMILQLVVWSVWCGVIYLVATMMGGTRRAEASAFLRSAGFATAPGLLGVLYFIPLLGILVWLISIAWVFAATTVATRESFGLNTLLALVACAVGFAVCVGVGFGVLAVLATALRA